MTRKAYISVLAGIFAVTNMGHNMPHDDLIAQAKNNSKNEDPVSAVYTLASQYMDDYHAEKGFIEEAKCWFDELMDMDNDRIAEIWPEQFAKIADMI